MRKPAICICENKGTDQLGGNHVADQHHFSCKKDSTIPSSIIQNFKPLAIFCGCTAPFVSDLVRNLEDGFLVIRLISKTTLLELKDDEGNPYIVSVYR